MVKRVAELSLVVLVLLLGGLGVVGTGAGLETQLESKLVAATSALSQSGDPNGQLLAIVLQDAPRGVAGLRGRISVSQGRITAVQLTSLYGVGVELAENGKSAVFGAVDFTGQAEGVIKGLELAHVWVLGVTGLDKVQATLELFFDDQRGRFAGVPLGVERVNARARLESLEVNADRTTGTYTFTALGSQIQAIQLQVFDLSGDQVYRSEFVVGGSLRWDAFNNASHPVANGIYLYVVLVRGLDGTISQSRVQKLVVLR